MSKQEKEELNDEFSLDSSERLHFEKVCNAYRCYRRYELNRIGIAERQFLSIPERHRQLLPNHLVQLAKLSECVDTNYQFLLKILEGNETIFENSDLSAADAFDGVPEKKAKNDVEKCGSHCESDGEKDCEKMSEAGRKQEALRLVSGDFDKVRSTLKQFVRDWSAFGVNERNACYEPVLAELRRRYSGEERGLMRVLLPGAGLCRLAWEVARLGFETHANEVSFYMLLAANFVLNRCSHAEEFAIYPFAHEPCNNVRFADQVAAVLVPDCDPNALALAAAGEATRFEMSAGDFVEVYSKETERGRFDCVVTMFFIDTAHNVVEYVETLRAALKPGGLWINLGPLLFHYADMSSELSIEISYDELRALVARCGFQIEVERTVQTGYCQNTNSMLQFVYNTQFFVARKL